MFHERLTHSLHCSEFVELTLIYRIGKTALQRWGSTVRKYGYELLRRPNAKEEH